MPTKSDALRRYRQLRVTPQAPDDHRHAKSCSILGSCRVPRRLTCRITGEDAPLHLRSPRRIVDAAGGKFLLRPATAPDRHGNSTWSESKGATFNVAILPSQYLYRNMVRALLTQGVC